MISNNIIRDLIPVSRLFIKDDRENMKNDDEECDSEDQTSNNTSIKNSNMKRSKTMSLLTLVIFVLIGYIAAVLSWNANKKFGYSTLSCVLCSIIAFFSGWLYILAYVLFRLDLVTLVTKNPQLLL